jgi:CheY-like chemotaxis protein
MADVIDPGAYRVLVFDDDRDTCELAKEQIAAIADSTRIHVDVAYTPHIAIKMVRSSYYDLLLLDLYKERVLAGRELYRSLNELGCSADVIFMTRFDLEPSVETLLRAVAAGGSAQLVGFIDKRNEERESIPAEIAKRYERFAAAELNISNLSLASKLIDRRRERYHRPGLLPLRESLSEIDAEVERLLRQLYVELPPSMRRTTGVSVSLEPMERRGLSAAVVINAIVEIGFPNFSDVHGGHRTVLKIGPKPDILEEASRFREFVRYGVKLDQRVELLGVATRDSLGALVYSFAGGVYGRELAALDDVLISDLRADSLELSRTVLDNLFNSRHWYSVRTDDVPVSNYFKDNYRNDLKISCRDGEKSLLVLGKILGDGFRVERVPQRGGETHFEVSMGGPDTLAIPDSSVLGLARMLGSVPTCLVHGDMHAGNVMLEVSERPSDRQASEKRKPLTLNRACLIDFRNAGPGPRTIDAVALESSVRLADSEAVSRSINELGEIALTDAERFDAARLMVGRVNAEIEMYRAVFGDSPDRPMEGWQALAAEILSELRVCFPEVTLQEYLRTSIRYVIRQLGFNMEPVARVRLLSWLAAQYVLLRELRA